ncbi:MAG: dihydroorotate dehydrogenase-like protein [Planctomycetes bacterium]|nr:dihydroorotate dehydrogenase-like protein [Planctomycetota bacterium]
MSVDLRTTYLGMELSNPVVVSACPMAEDVDQLARLEDAGAAAAVFPSLFEEQIEREELEIHGFYEQATESFAESVTYFPEMTDYNVGPGAYLRRLEEARKRVSIPVIGSLNGISAGGWVHYARQMQQAGASAIELNTFVITADLDADAATIEKRQVELVKAVRAAVTIPLAVKISPFYSATAHFAKQLVDAGADGLVLFNRFVHPDIDLDTLTVRPHLKLSRSYDGLLPMTWIALLHKRVDASLAATRGVHTAEDALKMLLVGADIVEVASTLYENGPEQVGVIRDGIRSWLEHREYESVEQAKGSLSYAHSPDPAAFERAGYLRTLASYTSRVV